jgi:hypothetical protein
MVPLPVLAPIRWRYDTGGLTVVFVRDAPLAETRHWVFGWRQEKRDAWCGRGRPLPVATARARIRKAHQLHASSSLTEHRLAGS